MEGSSYLHSRCQRMPCTVQRWLQTKILCPPLGAQPGPWSGPPWLQPSHCSWPVPAGSPGTSPAGVFDTASPRGIPITQLHPTLPGGVCPQSPQAPPWHLNQCLFDTFRGAPRAMLPRARRESTCKVSSLSCPAPFSSVSTTGLSSFSWSSTGSLMN